MNIAEAKQFISESQPDVDQAFEITKSWLCDVSISELLNYDKQIVEQFLSDDMDEVLIGCLASIGLLAIIESYVKQCNEDV